MTTTAHQPTRKSNVLVICDTPVAHEAISGLFVGAGFPVTFLHEADVFTAELENYGAIVHVAHSNSLLSERLGARLGQIQDEEWVLIAGDDEEDVHCTVELTTFASATLRSFIQALWSRFNLS